MKKEIRIVDDKRGVVQITTIDERFYAFASVDKTTGLPTYIYKPSVTYVTAFYPKGKFFEEWLRKNGQEAELIKQLAGERGSKIHQACAALVRGQTIDMSSKFINPTTGAEEQLSAEEYWATLTFANWVKEAKPTLLNSEFVVEGPDYAGTVDLLCLIDGKKYIPDIKTSQYIWPSHELQVSAYKHTPGLEDATPAILQVGYRKNKSGYKFTEVPDKYELFRSVYSIFRNEAEGDKPRQIELPLSIALAARETKEKPNARHEPAE